MAELLGIPVKSIKSAEEGVYIVKDNPKQARVAVRVLAPAGSKQRDLEVYLDSQTRRVLEIK